jgi:Leucine-rich repeat (LRR) protein
MYLGTSARQVTPQITVLVRLKSFYMDNNPIRTIPWEFELFPALERISVLGCPIEELPLGLCKMRSLREVRTCSHEVHVSSSSYDMHVLSSSSDMNVSSSSYDTQVRTYSHEMLPRPPEPPLTTDQVLEKTAVLLEQFELMLRAYETRILKLADMGLFFFPNEAFQITALTVLDISMNKFTAVPTVVGNLMNLGINVLLMCC